MNFAIQTSDLTKRYGDRVVVDRIDLAVPVGSVYGFLGPNGSGKSTTMKMLLSLVRPSSGDATVLGRPMNRQTRRDILGEVGSLIESPPGYHHLTGAENMRLIQRLLGLDTRQIEQAVRTVRLQDQLDKRVAAYSLGMKQRLGIAMALARQPRLLILDEPTNGLDPAGVEEMRDLLRRLAASGITVLVSSHQLGEIDKCATSIGILSRGRLIFQGSRDQLLAQGTPDVVIECSEVPLAAELLRQQVTARQEGHVVRVRGADSAGVADAVARLVHAGIHIFEVRREGQTLENMFLRLTEGRGL